MSSVGGHRKESACLRLSSWMSLSDIILLHWAFMFPIRVVGLGRGRRQRGRPWGLGGPGSARCSGSSSIQRWNSSWFILATAPVISATMTRGAGAAGAYRDKS